MVNIASMMGHIGGTNSAAYTASKHAVVGLTKVLALEWAGLWRAGQRALSRASPARP